MHGPIDKDMMGYYARRISLFLQECGRTCDPSCRRRRIDFTCKSCDHLNEMEKEESGKTTEVQVGNE